MDIDDLADDQPPIKKLKSHDPIKKEQQQQHIKKEPCVDKKEQQKHVIKKEAKHDQTKRRTTISLQCECDSVNHVIHY